MGGEMNIRESTDTGEETGGNLKINGSGKNLKSKILSVKRARKKSLIKKHYPRRSTMSISKYSKYPKSTPSKITAMDSLNSDGAEDTTPPPPTTKTTTADTISTVGNKGSILYLPGPVVNLRTAQEFKLENIKTDEDFSLHCEQLSPKYGELVSYQLEEGESGVLQCFVKKSPAELNNTDFDFNISRYSSKYFMKIHWSVTQHMQASLRSLGFLTSDDPGVELEPITPLITRSDETKQIILKAILNSPGPLVTKLCLKSNEACNNIKPNINLEDFIHHSQMLSPDYGQLVRYGIRHKRNLACFIKKHPEEFSDTADIDIDKYTERYSMPINRYITPVMQVALKEHGYISLEMINQSQQILSAKMGMSHNDDEHDDSLVTETDDALHTPLPTERNEDIIRCILNAQGPIVTFKGVKVTFRKPMSNVKQDEFLSHARLLSPDYGKFVSFSCNHYRGKVFVTKCFIKKPPSELPGDFVPDLKRYSKRYYASLHATIPLATILALKKLGHISEQVFPSTGIFSPLGQQEASTAYEEQEDLEESNGGGENVVQE